MPIWPENGSSTGPFAMDSELRSALREQSDEMLDALLRDHAWDGGEASLHAVLDELRRRSLLDAAKGHGPARHLWL
jgi:hypothetical protein